jgi:hypothetical protein
MVRDIEHIWTDLVIRLGGFFPRRCTVSVSASSSSSSFSKAANLFEILTWYCPLTSTSLPSFEIKSLHTRLLTYSPSIYKSRDSSVGIAWAKGWTIGVLGFDSRRGLGIFLFTTASRTALGPTRSPIKRVPGVLSLEVKWQGHEADHSSPSTAEVKECVELYLHFRNTPSWRRAQLNNKSTGTTLPLLCSQLILDGVR